MHKKFAQTAAAMYGKLLSRIIRRLMKSVLITNAAFTIYRFGDDLVVYGQWILLGFHLRVKKRAFVEGK